MSRASLSGSPEDLVSLTSAAKRLRVGYRRLRAAIRTGDLPAYRVGGRRSRVLWGEVVQWVRQQRTTPEANSNHMETGGKSPAHPTLHVTITDPPIVRLQADYLEEQRFLRLRQLVEDLVREELARGGMGR